MAWDDKNYFWYNRCRADHRKRRGGTAPNRALGHVRPREYEFIDPEWRKRDKRRGRK